MPVNTLLFDPICQNNPHPSRVSLPYIKGPPLCDIHYIHVFYIYHIIIIKGYKG